MAPMNHKPEVVDIYWFSGTGNTLLVARAMGDRFAQRGVMARLQQMEDCDPADVDASHTIGIACPVAAQSTYPPVWRFVRGLPDTDGTGVFLIDTLMLHSGGIVGPMRSRLERKGYTPLGAIEVRMPGNFLRKKADPDKTARKVEAGMTKARAFTDDIVDGRSNWRRCLPWEWLFLASCRLCYGRLGLVRKFFRLSVDHEKCDSCGLGEELCPVGAISLRDGRPEFSSECIACMRCASYCPEEAILLNGKDYARNRPVKAADFTDDNG